MKSFGHECRQRYLEATSCACFAEGRAVSPRSLSVRTMNFGQHWRTPGVENVPYSVELPQRFWMDLVNRELPELVADAKRFPDDDTALDVELRRRGFPESIDVATAVELAPVAVRYFAHELLIEWLGDGPPDEEPGWVINTIDDIHVDVDRVRLSGSARRSGLPVRYQDV